MSRGDVIGIATGYWLDSRGVGVRVPVEQEFSLLHVAQTGSEAHPASYPMDTGGSFPRHEADHSPPNSAEVKRMWVYTSTPLYAFMAYCLLSCTGTTLPSSQLSFHSFHMYNTDKNCFSK
jgi:hypothetical protein